MAARDGLIRRLRRHALLACVLLPALVAGALAQGTARPIKIGAISTLSGSGSFPESPQAAKAYFDAVNASGGIAGRRLQYLSLDDRMDPQAASQAADELLADAEVMALAGGSSLIDCSVNQRRYEAAGIVSLQGASVAPECFRSPAIVPMNNGPYTGLATAVLFARQQLQARQLCAVALDLPGMVAGYEHALRRLAERGGPAAPPLRRIGLMQDPRPMLRELIEAGCDVVIHTGHEPAVLQWMQAVHELMPGRITWVFLTPAYTTSVARALAGSGETMYAMAEFEPWNSSSLSSLDWRRQMREAKLPLSSLAQGGYLSAQLLVRALRRVQGPITRASVAQALRSLPPTEHPLVGMPIVIGHAAAHNPNRSALPMKLDRGFWHIAAPRWIEAPTVND